MTQLKFFFLKKSLIQSFTINTSLLFEFWNFKKTNLKFLLLALLKKVSFLCANESWCETKKEKVGEDPTMYKFLMLIVIRCLLNRRKTKLIKEYLLICIFLLFGFFHVMLWCTTLRRLCHFSSHLSSSSGLFYGLKESPFLYWAIAWLLLRWF